MGLVEPVTDFRYPAPEHVDSENIKLTRLKILPVLTREHYTSLLHWV
jgi:hypothetical protein